MQTAVRKPHNFVTSQHRRRQSTTQQVGSAPAHLHCRLGVRPVNPLASLAEEDNNKVCLPAKRQPISTIGIGTGNAPFSTLQVKASGSLPRKQPQRTAKPTAFYALSAVQQKGVVNPRLLKFRGCITKKQAVSAVLRGVVQES